jgi:hypothetical protein
VLASVPVFAVCEHLGLVCVWVLHRASLRVQAIVHAGTLSCSAVYLDDMISGFTVTGNSFVNDSRALLLGGGRDNVFRCACAWAMSCGGTWWLLGGCSGDASYCLYCPQDKGCGHVPNALRANRAYATRSVFRAAAISLAAWMVRMRQFISTTAAWAGWPPPALRPPGS